MSVQVTLFGQLRHLANQDTLLRPLDGSGTLAEFLESLCTELGEDFRRLLLEEKRVRASVLVLINDTPIDKAQPPKLHDGDHLTLLPAIAGG